MAAELAKEKFWVNKYRYHDAEKSYHEGLAKYECVKQGLELIMGPEFSNDKVWTDKFYYHDAEKSYYEKLAKGLEKGNNHSKSRRRRTKKNLERGELTSNKCAVNDEYCRDNTKKSSGEHLNKHKKNKKKLDRIMAAELANEKFWVNKYRYHDAEKSYYEGLAKDGVGKTNVSKDPCIKSSLAVEVAKAREIIKTSMQRVDGITAMSVNEKPSGPASNTPATSADIAQLASAIELLRASLEKLEKRVDRLECIGGALVATQSKNSQTTQSKNSQTTQSIPPNRGKSGGGGGDDDDDDVDLFDSDSDNEDHEAKKIREQRLAEYAAKKSKKPTLIAKSNVILDVKPWNDETDMKKLEEAVRDVKMDGLVWGASKLVPLVFGVYKLQISCVIEDDKVSVDHLTELLEGIEDYIQSVDIAAFNKV